MRVLRGARRNRIAGNASLKADSQTTLKRYPGLTLRILGPRSAALGPGKAELLEGIDRSGSISAAAREMNMSYRRAWKLIEEVNASFNEPLCVTAVGGRSGGGAQVTELGRAVLTLFRKMEAEASEAIAADLRELQSFLNTPLEKREKCQTEAGRGGSRFAGGRIRRAKKSKAS